MAEVVKVVKWLITGDGDGLQSKLYIVYSSNLDFMSVSIYYLEIKCVKCVK